MLEGPEVARRGRCCRIFVSAGVWARSASGLPLRVSRYYLQHLDYSTLKQVPLCLALSSIINVFVLLCLLSLGCTCRGGARGSRLVGEGRLVRNGRLIERGRLIGHRGR